MNNNNVWKMWNNLSFFEKLTLNWIHTHKCSYLIFLQCDLSHLSVPYKGACHLENSFCCAHFYEVVGGEVARLVPHLSLKKRQWIDFQFILQRKQEQKTAHLKHLNEMKYEKIKKLLNSPSTTLHWSHPVLWSDHQGYNTHNKCLFFF